MKKIIVVNSTKNWTFEINNDSVKVIDAKSYLTQTKYFEMRDVRVFNLCKNSKYQSTGYYVSLLAEARGQKVIPSITTIQDFNSQRLQKIFTDELENDIQQSLKNIKSDHFTLSVYFGKNTAKQHNKLAKNIYNLFQAPLLRAEFEFKKWVKKLELRLVLIRQEAKARFIACQESRLEGFNFSPLFRFEIHRNNLSINAALGSVLPAFQTINKRFDFKNP